MGGWRWPSGVKWTTKHGGWDLGGESSSSNSRSIWAATNGISSPTCRGIFTNSFPESSSLASAAWGGMPWTTSSLRIWSVRSWFAEKQQQRKKSFYFLLLWPMLMCIPVTEKCRWHFVVFQKKIGVRQMQQCGLGFELYVHPFFLDAFFRDGSESESRNERGNGVRGYVMGKKKKRVFTVFSTISESPRDGRRNDWTRLNLVFLPRRREKWELLAV